MESSFSGFSGNLSNGTTHDNQPNSDKGMTSGTSEDEPGVSSGLPNPRTPPTSSLPEKAAKPGSGGKKKKRKTPTDVNAPKKPVSAYITYLNERRETVKNENPTMTYPDILKKLAAEWSSMSTEGRKKYHEEANKAREKYNLEISEYKTTDLYKKFCDEQNAEQQQKLHIQFPSLAQKVAAQQQKSPPTAHANTFSKQPAQGPIQQTSQLAAHLQSPTNFRSQQPLIQQPQQPLIQQPQHQQMQRQLSGPAPSELKRELATDSPPARAVGSSFNAPPFSTSNHVQQRPRLSIPQPTTPMSPNQTPSPRVMSPSFRLQNVTHPYRYPPPNSASHPITPVGNGPGGPVPSPLRSNSSMTMDVGQDGEMKSHSMSEEISRQNSVQSYDIPIFTEEFLEHNRSREGELRHFKKHNTQLEEQNVMLSKHVENMKAAIGKLDSDALHQRTHNRSLQQQLDNLRATLSSHLSGLPLPGSKDPPNRDNIDDYMNTVYRMMTESPKPENQHFINVFKETIWNLEFTQNQT